MKQMRKTTLLLTLIILGFTGFTQNDVTATKMFWVGGQAGCFKTVNDITGFSGGLNLNAVVGNNLYKARYFYDERFELFEPVEKYNEAGLLIGKSFYTDKIQVNLSAGLGITTGKLVSETTEIRDDNTGWVTIVPSVQRIHEYEYFTTPGIPLEVELMLKPAKVLGLGLSFSGNLNMKRPVFRTSLSLSFGRMR